MAESLLCLPETIKTLLSGYMPMQNVFSVKRCTKQNKIKQDNAGPVKLV